MNKKQKKSNTKSRRGKRDYVGEDPEDPTTEQPENNQGTEEIPKRGGILKHIFDKNEKLISLYKCPECQEIYFQKPQEMQEHFEMEHGLILVIEDIEPLKVEMTKQETNRALQRTWDAIIQDQKMREIQEKRITKEMEKPKDLEPQQIISDREAKNPVDVYIEAMNKIAGQPDPGQDIQGNEKYYVEELKGDMVEVSMIMQFPRSQEVFDALNRLKNLMS